MRGGDQRSNGRGRGFKRGGRTDTPVESRTRLWFLSIRDGLNG